MTDIRDLEFEMKLAVHCASSRLNLAQENLLRAQDEHTDAQLEYEKAFLQYQKLRRIMMHVERFESEWGV